MEVSTDPVAKVGTAAPLQAKWINQASPFRYNTCCCTRSSDKRGQPFLRRIHLHWRNRKHATDLSKRRRCLVTSSVTSSTAATWRPTKAALTRHDLSGPGGISASRMYKPGLFFLSQVGALPCPCKSDSLCLVLPCPRSVILCIIKTFDVLRRLLCLSGNFLAKLGVCLWIFLSGAPRKSKQDG